MKNILHIARRELASYFLSPIAYISLVVFYAALGIFFYLFITGSYMASMMGATYFMGLMLVLVAPVLTMRLIAEERRLGTLEGLMTAPVTHTALVVGKFLGALAFFVILLLPSLFHAWLLFHLSSSGPDVWKLAANYLGLLLLGAFMFSFGTFCSSLTRSQVAAALAGIAILFVLWLLSDFLRDTPPYSLTGDGKDQVLRSLYRAAAFVAYPTHLRSFLDGALDLRDIVFFVSFTVFFLFLAVCTVANRKWR